MEQIKICLPMLHNLQKLGSRGVGFAARVSLVVLSRRNALEIPLVPGALLTSRNTECVPRMQTENNSRNPSSVHAVDDRPIITTESGIPTPVTNVPTISDIGPLIQPPARDEGEKALLQAFFDLKDATKYIFLHAPTIMAEWKRGGLDPVLVKTLCATGLGGGNCKAGDRERVASWFRDSQAAVLSCLGTLSLSQLQALVLIIHYHDENGNTVEAWNLLAVAARLAFTLKLNHEHSTHNPIA